MGTKMNSFKKALLLLSVMGVIYLNLEIFMRAIRGDLLKVGFHGVSWFSFAGWTTLWMFPIGGLCGLFIGALNEIKGKKLPMWLQSLIGMIGVFTIEFITGLFFNVFLGLNLWTYENWPLNIMGQITLLYIPLWYLLVPFVVWVDDLSRYLLFKEEKPLSLIGYYKKLFSGK